MCCRGGFTPPAEVFIPQSRIERQRIMMEESKGARDSMEGVAMGDEEYEEIVDELRELHELQNTKTFLEAENRRLKNEIEALTAELEGINIAMSSAEAYMASYEGRRKKCAENIERLRPKRDMLTAEISDLSLKIKASREDKESTSNLSNMLKDELYDIEGEKRVVLKRLNDIKTGLQQISSDRDVKLPHLKWYDVMLKQIHNVFMETQNRMEVSLILRSR
jgi:chromosome segregation ATPase